MWGSPVLPPPYEAHAFKGSLVKPWQSTVQPPHPVMLHVLLEEDLGMFSALSLCSALGTTALWGTVPQERINIHSFPIRDSITQDNANSESFWSVLLPTHKHKAKICHLEQDCLTQRFSFPFCLCAPLARELCFCAGQTSECKGNHIWEIMPLLMYKTTKTSPWICHQTKLQYW